MPRLIVMDELHVTLLAPRRLSVPEQDAVTRALNDPSFTAGLRRAVRRLMRRRPELSPVRVRVTR